LLETVSRILPGDRGKVGSGWLTGPLSSRVEIHLMRQAGFTSSSGGVRTPSVMRTRNLAARGDEKPLRVESSSPGWFRIRANRSYPEGKGCYCGSARADDSGGFRKGIGQRKDAERRDKVSIRTGKGTEPRQGS
jgi:hypothetical protein